MCSSDLRLPNTFTSCFIEKQDSIAAYQADKYLSKRQTVAVQEQSKRGRNKDRSASNPDAQYYKVRKGDTLGGIADKYRTTVAQLRKLNGIKGNNIVAGKSIRVK